MTPLEVSTSAPNFSLPDQDGKMHTLEEYRGKWVILFFYPKDDTPGCTIEACAFRDMTQEYSKEDAVILGISCDTENQHHEFAEKYDLSFCLLADTEKQTVQHYRVWQEKKLFGKTAMGIQRTTYLIDPHGNIAKIYAQVRPEGHAREVLEDLQKLAKNR